MRLEDAKKFRIDWESPGPTIDRYMDSTAVVQALMGPIGGGKTSSGFIKAILLAQKQRPSPRDGVRRFKLCVVHKTYRRLWASIIPSWWKWMPKSVGEWTGALDQPAQHRITFGLVDGTTVELTIDFIAIGDNAAEDVLRGYEPTAFLLVEADLLDRDVLTFARGRAGRFPAMAEGGPTWYGVLLDFNAPDIESWIYDTFVENKPPEFDFFRQPDALSPQAENLKNLPPGYYEAQMAGQPDWYIRRMIRNQFGYSRDGLPIYPEYNDPLHCAPEDLAPLPGLPLLIGGDAGGTPAATLWQHAPNGQWRGIDEITSEVGRVTGPGRFSDALNRLLSERYPAWSRPLSLGRGGRVTNPIEGWADPSAAYGSDKQDKEDQSWIEAVSAKTKIRFRPAPTNVMTPRVEALRLPMTRMIDGHTPGLLISPRMKVFRRGLINGYRLRKVKHPGGTVSYTPDKNEFSHVVESGQYVILGGGEYADVMGRAEALDGDTGQIQAVDEDHPYGEYSDEPGARRHGRRGRFDMRTADMD